MMKLENLSVINEIDTWNWNWIDIIPLYVIKRWFYVFIVLIHKRFYARARKKIVLGHDVQQRSSSMCVRDSTILWTQ